MTPKKMFFQLVGAPLLFWFIWRMTPGGVSAETFGTFVVNMVLFLAVLMCVIEGRVE